MFACSEFSEEPFCRLRLRRELSRTGTSPRYLNACTERAKRVEVLRGRPLVGRSFRMSEPRPKGAGTSLACKTPSFYRHLAEMSRFSRICVDFTNMLIST